MRPYASTSKLFGRNCGFHNEQSQHLGYEGKIYEISNPEFSVFVPDKDHTPSPLDKGLSFAVIGETGKLEFTPEIVNGWDTWKSLPKRVSEKGKTVYVFRKTQLIKVIKPKKLES